MFPILFVSFPGTREGIPEFLRDHFLIQIFHFYEICGWVGGSAEISFHAPGAQVQLIGWLLAAHALVIGMVIGEPMGWSIW